MSADFTINEKNYTEASGLLKEMPQHRSAWAWSKNYISVDLAGTISIIQLNFFERILRVLFGCVTRYHDTQLEIVRGRLKLSKSDQPHVKAVSETVEQIWEKALDQTHAVAYPNGTKPPKPQQLNSAPSNTSAAITSTATTSNVAKPLEKQHSQGAQPTTTSSSKPKNTAMVVSKDGGSSMVTWAFPRKNLILAMLDQKEFFGAKVLSYLDLSSKIRLLLVNRECRKLPEHKTFRILMNPFAVLSVEERIKLLTENAKVYGKLIVADGPRGGSGDSMDVLMTGDGRIVEEGVVDGAKIYKLCFGSRGGRGMISTSSEEDPPGFLQLQTRALIYNRNKPNKKGDWDNFESPGNYITPEMFPALFDLIAMSGRKWDIPSTNEADAAKYLAPRIAKYAELLRLRGDMRPTQRSLAALITVNGDKLSIVKRIGMPDNE